MAELLLPKQLTRVRFPSPAPHLAISTGIPLPSTDPVCANCRKLQICVSPRLNTLTCRCLLTYAFASAAPIHNKQPSAMSVKFNINGKAVTTNAEPDTPLLWVIRDELGMTGTKFGCGMALCGACTVHLDSPFAPARRPCLPYRARRSPPSRACRATTRIRCRSPGSSTMCRSAATASQASS
jgi:hypothetical protein